MLIEKQISERQSRARIEKFKIHAQSRGVFGGYQVLSAASKRT